MSDNAVGLLPVSERGWRRGFANLFAKENGRWWRTLKWLKQAILWSAIADGMTATVLYQADIPAGARVNAALVLFFIFLGMATSIGAIISMQGGLIEEKKSGTAAWVLSKPVSRASFVLSKLLSTMLGLLVTAVLIPGASAFIMFATVAPGVVHPVNFALGLALVFLNIAFYLTLPLFLNAFFNNRGPVLGISLALLLGYQAFLAIWDKIGYIMPWSITFPLQQTGGEAVSLAMSAAQGLPLFSIWPVVSTAVWCVLFTGLALWRFDKEEF